MKFDAEKGAGVELSERFKVQGYPTFVVLNSEGGTISRWAGYETAAEFIASLDEAKNDPTTVAEKEQRFESNPTPEDAVTLADLHASSGEFVDAADYVERAIELGSEEEGLDFKLFFVHRWGYAKEAFDVEQLRAAADRAVDSGRLSGEEHLLLARYMSSAAEDGDDWSPAPYLETALAATEGDDDPELVDDRRLVLIEHALRVTGDKETALTLKRETMEEGWEESSDELNGFAWWCYENRVNLEEAESLARKGVELAEEDADRAAVLDTLAELVFLRGEAEEAATLISRAIELAPDNDYYKEQLARFNGEPPSVM